MNAQEANRRQLDIWKRTIAYEVAMMAPRSVSACGEFLSRLERFEQQIAETDTNADCPNTERERARTEPKNICVQY
ncbi:hypothetical protein [Brevibacillus borstelensis]|uniref:hypothetical protein n=1 Tax=Brevibacillus borstelensis TaxID=45462 RepID=UPI0030BCC3FC